MKPNKHVNSYVTGKTGMVVSAHPLASQAGVKILNLGGNAFDAAIAVASSLCVVEPYMSGLGGVGVALIYVSREKQTRALNFSGRCPRDININRIDKADFDSGTLSSLIPGVVSGWKELHEKYGSLQWDSLFESSIDYAINGYDLTPLATHVISESHCKLENNIEA
ncbi:uncharacterized protein METZ01_LOCUS238993, partial [marine metagenome]